MGKKTQKSELEQIVRRHGLPQAPSVDPLQSEVRSCLVASHPRPVEDGIDGLLGGVVVMSEFSLPFSEIQGLHDFLRKNEAYIAESLKKIAKGALYRGTYMLYGAGQPRYRTVWSYDSIEMMGEVWSKALSDEGSNLYKAVRQLRAYWLRDPDRTEARWVPAYLFFDPKTDNGDAFAKLTIDADALNSKSKR